MLEQAGEVGPSPIGWLMHRTEHAGNPDVQLKLTHESHGCICFALLFSCGDLQGQSHACTSGQSEGVTHSAAGIISFCHMLVMLLCDHHPTHLLSLCVLRPCR